MWIMFIFFVVWNIMIHHQCHTLKCEEVAMATHHQCHYNSWSFYSIPDFVLEVLERNQFIHHNIISYDNLVELNPTKLHQYNNIQMNSVMDKHLTRNETKINEILTNNEANSYFDTYTHFLANEEWRERRNTCILWI